MAIGWTPLALTALLAGAPAWAHHSYAAYDFKDKITVGGAVVQFRWANPHSELRVAAPRPGGGTQTWEIELGAPGLLTRVGWKRTSLQRGDKVEVTFAPRRDGGLGGHLTSVTTLADGRTLTEPFFLSDKLTPQK